MFWRMICTAIVCKKLKRWIKMVEVEAALWIEDDWNELTLWSNHEIGAIWWGGLCNQAPGSWQFMHYGMSPVGAVPPRNTASRVGWTFVPWAVTGSTRAYSKAEPVFIPLSIHISCSPPRFILQVKLGVGWTKLAALKVNGAYSGLSQLPE
jgi:hypothetical protein